MMNMVISVTNGTLHNLSLIPGIGYLGAIILFTLTHKIMFFPLKKLGYFIEVMEREKDGGYSRIEEMPLGIRLNPGDLAKAIKNGFEKATV